MTYNFDEIIERRGTDAIKYDLSLKKGLPEDVISLWVADMDFKSPQPVIDALEERVRHGLYGYNNLGKDYIRALTSWYSTRFGWEIDPEWIVEVPGVVYGVTTAIRALSEEGDGVLIQQPVYYPFARQVMNNGRKLVVNQLVYSEGKYTVDFEDFEAQILQHQVKLFILCSPHNPIGRVWTEEELTRMGQICLRHGVQIISDEIHADFVYPGQKHFVLSNLHPDFAMNTVTCTAPSKTFNLAGLQVSNIFIPNPQLRKSFADEMRRQGVGRPGIMGITACQAAYAHGAEWLDQVLEYLQGNLNYARDFIKNQLPMLHLVEPEGTYLLWIDCRKLGLTDPQLEELITRKARLWVDEGTMFGRGGEGFIRINIACPRSVLVQAFHRLKEAIEAL